MTEQELIDKIKYHQNLYWNNTPEIPDSEYDMLMQNLKELNPDSEILNKIEYNSESNSDKIRHSDLMLSLDKVFDYKSILDWALKYCRNKDELLTITPKYDGISARLYIETNTLSTRGDGEYGENITDKMKFINFEMSGVTHPNYYNGEIIVSKSEFEKIQKEFKRKDGKSYSNPRNFVGGFLNSKDLNLNEFKLTFIEHTYLSYPVTLKDFTEEKWNEISSEIIKLNSDIPMDGIVISIADDEYIKQLGETSHHPRGKIAFKFETEFQYSKINNIEFSCGKRKITPVAIIEPVVINNVTIKRVTLHNAKMLLDNDVHINDIVKVVRSGDVIPYVAEIKPAEEARKKIAISKCPICNSKLIYKEPDLICPNESCDGSNAKLLYQSIQTLGIDNIGLTTVEKMMEVLEVSTIQDILELTEDDLQYVPGFGEKSIAKIYNNIQDVKTNIIEDFKLLACLNIKGIGNSISKSILEKCTLTDLSNNIHGSDFTNIFGIGEIRAEELLNGIIENYDLLQYLMKTLNYVNTKSKKKKDSKGIICFTGKFDLQKSYYYELATSSGYEISETVTKSMLFVVSNGASTTKTSKARTLGIKVISIDSFLKLVGQ